jgi:hypothetical protein
MANQDTENIAVGYVLQLQRAAGRHPQARLSQNVPRCLIRFSSIFGLIRSRCSTQL